MGDALNMVAMPDDPVSAEHFVRAAQRPAPRPEISGDSIPAVEEEPSTEWSVANWLTSIRAVSAHLADSLVGDARAARRSELAAMAALADGDDAAVVSRLRARLSAGTDELARLLLPRVRELAAAVAAGAATGEALQSKFCESGAFTLQHLTLADFFKGLEGRIGAPTPGSVSTVLESMRGEHTTGPPPRRQPLTLPRRRPRAAIAFLSHGRHTALTSLFSLTSLSHTAGTSQGVEPHEPFLTATTSALDHLRAGVALCRRAGRAAAGWRLASGIQADGGDRGREPRRWPPRDAARRARAADAGEERATGVGGRATSHNTGGGRGAPLHRAALLQV